MVIDFDDFGANHVISDVCQSHDCRDKLDALHYANPAFKVTLFAIPFEMTQELLDWCHANRNWVELAVHGFRHQSNYECEKMPYDEFNDLMATWMIPGYFVKGFKAPGWQISDDIYRWLLDHGWWLADQSYNNMRRPDALPCFEHIVNGNFHATGRVNDFDVYAWHGHTWDCCGNGIYETFDHVKSLVQNAKEFQFVSEVLA